MTRMTIQQLVEVFTMLLQFIEICGMLQTSKLPNFCFYTGTPSC